MLNKLFKLKENNTNVKTEVIAGLTTFMAMAYILAVNPNILSGTGMNRDAVLLATAIASFIVPNESFGAVFRLLKFLFIVTAAIWGIYGYLLTFAALLLHLSQIESFGVPYMLPSVCGENLNYDDKKDHYVRYPFAYMKKRPVFTREGRRIRKR